MENWGGFRYDTSLNFRRAHVLMRKLEKSLNEQNLSLFWRTHSLSFVRDCPLRDLIFISHSKPHPLLRTISCRSHLGWNIFQLRNCRPSLSCFTLLLTSSSIWVRCGFRGVETLRFGRVARDILCCVRTLKRSIYMYVLFTSTDLHQQGVLQRDLSFNHAHVNQTSSRLLYFDFSWCGGERFLPVQSLSYNFKEQNRAGSSWWLWRSR